MRPSSPLARIVSVRVGSLNGPKIEAVRAALEPYAPDVTVRGVAVESGVPEQPIGHDEIVAGARNRARRALATGDCELAVGIEDGLVALEILGRREVLNVGCAFVASEAREAMGFSSAFAYPPQCIAPALEQRAPIGDVFDRVFRAHTGDAAPYPVPSGRTSGNIGKLTGGVLPRSDYARHAVLCALVHFLHPDLYDQAPLTTGSRPHES